MAEMTVPRPPDRDTAPATPIGTPDNQQPMSHEARDTIGTDVERTSTHADPDVVQTAKEQGLHVAAETGQQARYLYDRAVGEVTEQAAVQQKRLVNGLYALSDEAARMAAAGGQSGAMTPIVEEAAHRFRQAGLWLERREPGDVLREVNEFARQNPGTFLVGAAVLGVLAGRLTKNLASADTSDTAPTPTRATPTMAPPGADRPYGTTDEWSPR